MNAAKTRPGTPEERQRMAELLNEAMDAGAIGFAFSFQKEKNGHTDFDGTPMPTDIMDPEEAYLLGEVLKERGEGVIQCLVDMPGMQINRGIIEELAEDQKRSSSAVHFAQFDVEDSNVRDFKVTLALENARPRKLPSFILFQNNRAIGQREGVLSKAEMIEFLSDHGAMSQRTTSSQPSAGKVSLARSDGVGSSYMLSQETLV